MIGLTEAKSFLDVIGKYFSVLFILGLTLLFMPINLAEKMGVLIFVKQYQSWISVTTLASGAFFIYYLIKIICSKISFYLKEQRRKKIVLRFLKTLSEAEVELLQNCVKKNEQTILLEFSNPIAHSLITKGLLLQAGGTGNVLNWPFTIPHFVWDRLLKEVKFKNKVGETNG